MSGFTLSSVPGVTHHFASRPTYYLPRPRLVTSLLDTLAARQIVILQAPAGYGKTSLLLDCLQSLTAPTVYFRFRATFPETLGVSFADIYRVNAATPEAIEAAARVYGETKSLEAALNAIAAAAAHHGPVVVMLDDYPIAEDGARLSAMPALLSELPPYVHIIVASRGQPDLPLARWSAAGRLALYTQHELRFSPDEATRVVSTALGRELHPPEVEFLDKNVAGWALGLSLIAAVLAAREDERPRDRLLPEIGLIWAINEYLEHEVMQVQAVPPPMREFLEQTSVLPDLGIDICNSFMQLENSGEILRSLERHGFYISHVDDAATIYAYHPVFRRFLQKQLRERGGAAALAAAHLRAARVFEGYRLWRQAVWHYLFANEHGEAERLIEEHSVELLEGPATQPSIEYVKAQSVVDPASDVLEQLNMLPPEMVEARPFLLIVKARALLLRGNDRSARRIWNIVLELLQSELAALTEARSDLAGADPAARRGPIEGLLQKMWPGDPRAPAVRAEALHSLSLALGDFADTLKAVAVEAAALAVAGEIPHAATRLESERRILFRLARLYLYRADFRALGEVIARLCRIGADGTKDDAGFTWFCSEGRVRLAMVTGNLEAANHLAPEWQHQVGQDPEHTESGDRLQLLLGRLALLDGDYDRAETHFSEATFSPFDVIHLRLLQGRLEEALHLIRQALESFPAGEWSLERHLALTWLGVVESRNGQLGTGARRLEAEVQVFREKEMFFWQMGAELHLAWVLMQLGEVSRATTYVESALTRAASIPTTYFVFWHPAVIAFVCDVAEANDMHTDYVTNDLRRRATVAPEAAAGAPSQNGLAQRPAQPRDISAARTTATPPRPSVLKGKSALQHLVEQDYISPYGITKLLDTYHLTPRETEVFVWYVSPDIRIGSQRVNQAIADRLFLSELTVRAHISAILKKLDLPGRDRLHLRSWAIREGIIPE